VTTRRRHRVRAVRWGTRAVCAFAFLIPLQPVLIMPDGSPLRFAAADVVAPLVFLAGLARPRRRLPFGLAAFAGAISLLAVFATLWAGLDRSLSQYAVGKTAGLLYLVGLCLCATRCLEAGGETAVLRALAAGGVWSAVIGLVAFAASLKGVETELVSGGRLCSTMLGDPNIYCSLLAVSLLIVVRDPRLSARARLAGGTILGLALLATGSRSGLVGTVAGLAASELLRHRDPWAAGVRSLYVAASVALASGAALMTDQGWRAAQVLWEHVWRTWTVESRFDLYARAWQQFSEHPVLGVGIGGFKDLNAWEHGGHAVHSPVHNTYLWALVDLGLGGGFLLTGLIVAAIWWSVRAARQRPAAEGAATIAAGIGTLAMFNLFVDGFYQRHFWILLACALALPRARRTAAAPMPARVGQPLACPAVAR
jgi:O-antigen ligase